MLVVVADGRDLDRVDAALTIVLAEDGNRSTHVALSAALGPEERYVRFLRGLRGEVSVVAGTRAAAFAPVRDLGLVVMWDDGDDLYAEPRAPYPHAREVLGPAVQVHRFFEKRQRFLVVRVDEPRQGLLRPAQLRWSGLGRRP